MSAGENRQLLIAAAAALLVLAGGAWLWFGAVAEEPAPEPLDVDVSRHRLTPTAPALPPSARATADTEEEPTLTPEEKVAMAEANRAAAQRRRPPPPSLVSVAKEPIVRPPTATDAVHAALKPLQDQFGACYQAHLAEDPEAKGRAVLSFDLSDGALASDVQVELRAVGSITVRDCIAGVAPEADFSGVEGDVKVIWPMTMWPDRGLEVQEPVEDL